MITIKIQKNDRYLTDEAHDFAWGACAPPDPVSHLHFCKIRKESFISLRKFVDTNIGLTEKNNLSNLSQ